MRMRSRLAVFGALAGLTATLAAVTPAEDAYAHGAMTYPSFTRPLWGWLSEPTPRTYRSAEGEEVSEPVIRDRQTLSSEGVVVIMALAGKTPSVEVITRGVSQNHRELGGEVEKIALEALKRGVREKRTLSDIRDDIFYPVRRHLRKATGRNPLIVPTVIES